MILVTCLFTSFQITCKSLILFHLVSKKLLLSRIITEMDGRMANFGLFKLYTVRDAPEKDSRIWMQLFLDVLTSLLEEGSVQFLHLYFTFCLDDQICSSDYLGIEL